MLLVHLGPPYWSERATNRTATCRTSMCVRAAPPFDDRRPTKARQRMGIRPSSSVMVNRFLSFDKVLANFTLLGGGLGRRIRPKPQALGRCGGARVPSGCPLRTSPTVKLIAARPNLVFPKVAAAAST